MTSPLVSVIIPCYNTGHFLHLPVESVLNQPYENFELLIVNDGSTDPQTLECFEKLNHPKIRIIHQKNRGLAGARNGGIEQARGKYILPLDADDKTSPIGLSRPVEILETQPEISVVYGNVQYFGDENRLVKPPKFNAYRVLLANCFVVSSMFRRSAWEEVGGYTERTLGFEDWEFWLKLIEKNHKFLKVDDVLFHYHKRYNSDLYKTLKIYRPTTEQIKTLHPKLYSLENMKRLRKENSVKWWEDLAWQIPLPLRDRVNRITPLRAVKDWIRDILWKP
ncbi:MAG: glycosyltransferase [Deltaproteobacteria bacterium]|nr:glycosyltransferase [Deltaproteobacteria bacterium]